MSSHPFNGSLKLAFDASNGAGAADAENMLAEIADFRTFAIDIWQTRSVLLMPEEQDRLKDELNLTMQFLRDLTCGA